MYTSALSVSENVLANVAQWYSSLELHIKHSRLLAPDTQPDLIRQYAVRPNLGDHRVFLPTAHIAALQAASPEKPVRLPVVISFHGSAWIVGNPSDDDSLARYVADHARVVFVSVNYSKAPQHPFPAAFEDVLALVPAVLDDAELPIDPDRAVLSGGSSGGNLVLAAALALDPAVKTRIAGMVAICPPVDMVTTKEAKMGKRRRPEVPDILEPFYDMIKNVYLEKNRDTQPMEDLRLSPSLFVNRDDFPKNMYIIGFEDDLLCWEAESFAEKLAGDADRVPTKYGWNAGGVTWELIQEQGHGFAPAKGEAEDAKKVRENELNEFYGRTSDWVVNLFADSATKS